MTSEQENTTVNQNSASTPTTKPTSEERLMVVLIYVLSFFTSIIAPLIIWLIKRDTSEFVDRAGKNYFNFFISYVIWYILSGILLFVLIGFIALPVIAILDFIFRIVAAVKAYKGKDYLIPLSIPFFK